MSCGCVLLGAMSGRPPTLQRVQAGFGSEPTILVGHQNVHCCTESVLQWCCLPGFLRCIFAGFGAIQSIHMAYTATFPSSPHHFRRRANPRSPVTLSWHAMRSQDAFVSQPVPVAGPSFHRRENSDSRAATGPITSRRAASPPQVAVGGLGGGGGDRRRYRTSSDVIGRCSAGDCERPVTRSRH